MKKKSSLLFFIIGVFMFIVQVKTRPIDFKYSGHTKKYHDYERESKRIQKDILGEKIFNLMETIDNKIPLNF